MPLDGIRKRNSLRELDWGSDRVIALFDWMKTKSVDLASLTVEFFEYEFLDELTQDEAAYLENLKKRKTREPVDDDREFYEKRRKELEAARRPCPALRPTASDRRLLASSGTASDFEAGEGKLFPWGVGYQRQAGRVKMIAFRVEQHPLQAR